MEQAKVLELLKDMSLEEKIGQLFQGNGSFYESDSIATGPAAEQGFSEETVHLSGSILGAAGAAVTKKIQKEHMEKHPHHIPMILMADVINGYKTIFPIPLAQGAAFMPELAKTGAEIAAKEAAAAGLHVTFAPMVDLVRDARWGRVMESTGEDPYLNSAYAAAMVKGFQGDDIKEPGKIGACVKHFAAYGAPTAGRDYNNVELSERTLRDDYLPAYEAAVKAGVALVMTSFNTLNRIPSSANKWLLRDVLREEMGFDGVVISDWAAIEEIKNHNLALDHADAARLAMEAGTDIDMMTTCYPNYLKGLIESGEVSEALLDEAVLRVLELKNKLGLFENPYKDADEEQEKELLLCPKHRKAAREAASETFVLLENDGILPLKQEEKVAFVGPYTEEKAIIGSWSIFGNNEDAVSIHEGMDAAGIQAVFEKGCEVLDVGVKMAGFGSAYENKKSQEEIDKMTVAAVEAAKNAEKVVLCIGEHMVQTGEGASRGDITIPEGQLRLLREVAAVNDNVAVVLFGGRPVDLREVKKLAKAILMVWMPGTEGGNAIADVLYGKVSPGGRLPMSFPYCVGQVPVCYAEFNTGRHFETSQPDNRFQSRYLDIPNAPLYPFGYGLDYSEFSYSDVSLSSDVLERGKIITAKVTVKNIGKCKGSEVVQMYIRDDKGSVVRPVRELRGFEKIQLEVGEEKEVSFVINEELLKFHDINMNDVAEAGSFTVYIGGDSTTENQAVFQLK